MFYFKCVSDGFIDSIGKSENRLFEEIDFAEYSKIKELSSNRPTTEIEKHEYKLKVDLTWELVAVPEKVLSETEQKAQAYDILMGVSE